MRCKSLQWFATTFTSSERRASRRPKRNEKGASEREKNNKKKEKALILPRICVPSFCWRAPKFRLIYEGATTKMNAERKRA